jgi:hypothetical protein
MHNCMFCILCIYCIFIAHNAHLLHSVHFWALTAQSGCSSPSIWLRWRSHGSNTELWSGSWWLGCPASATTTAGPSMSARATSRHAQDNANHRRDYSWYRQSNASNGRSYWAEPRIPDQADPIQSERCGRKSRQAELKQKAHHITWSMAESFEYFTSKPSSMEEDADILWY